VTNPFNKKALATVFPLLKQGQCQSGYPTKLKIPIDFKGVILKYAVTSEDPSGKGKIVPVEGEEFFRLFIIQGVQS
jgi:hypothetical protein